MRSGRPRVRLIAAAALGLSAQAATAQGIDAAQVTLGLGAFGGPGLSLPLRASGDVALDFGHVGIQAGATVAQVASPPASGETAILTSSALILYTDPRPRWRLGAELGTTTDDAYDAEAVIAGRVLWHTEDSRVDVRGAGYAGGPVGAFSVTVAMEQRLRPDVAVHGVIHRYSTDKEIGDFYAIGLGGAVALRDDLAAHGSVVAVLADDYSYASNVESLGLIRDLGQGRRIYGGLSRRDTDADTSYGVSAGIRIGLGGSQDDRGALFDTDPFGQRLAHLGH